MKRLIVSVLLLAFLAPVSAWADVLWLPRAELVHVSFKQKADGVVGGTAFTSKYDVDILSARLGVTAAFEKFYVDFYYQDTIDKDSDTVSSAINPVPMSFEADRSEYALTAGYRFNDRFSLFAGYRFSDGQAEASANDKVATEIQSFFAGGSYSFPLSETVILSLNAAYAYINDVDNQYRTSLPAPTVINMSGDGNGWKVGAGLNGVLSGDWGYSFGIDYYDYDYDTTSNAAGADISINDRELFLRAGLNYAFY